MFSYNMVHGGRTPFLFCQEALSMPSGALTDLFYQYFHIHNMVAQIRGKNKKRGTCIVILCRIIARLEISKNKDWGSG